MNIIIHSSDVQRVIKKYDEKIYANKFNKLDELDEVFEGHEIPKLTEEEI